MAVNNTENEKYNAFFYLTDCSPYEDRSNRSLTSLLSAMIETWQSHDLLTAGCDILHRHKRIYLSSWPWLPTVTMPDHRVITTFTLVKFLLSFAAFTEVLVSVYTRKMFTWVSKLSYLSKPFKSKHGKSELMSDLLFTDHQHGGDDVTFKPPIGIHRDLHLSRDIFIWPSLPCTNGNAWRTPEKSA